MNEHINMNNDWKYSPTFQKQMTNPSYDEATMETVRLPHTNVITPYHYFDEQIYQFVSCYRKRIFANEAWKEKQVLITFEGVGHVAKVYLNEKLVTTHNGGYTAFTADLAPHLIFGEDNVLVVEVDSRESSNLPPFGNVIDYLTYGGIYREVYLDIKEVISIEDVFVMTRDLDNAKELNSKEVELWITLHGLSEEEQGHSQHAQADQEKHSILSYSICDAAGGMVYQNKCSISQRTTKIIFSVTGVLDWDIEQPNLYNLDLELLAEGKPSTQLDKSTIRFGFRTCEFREDGFYLNHKKLKLLGLNRHQCYPYVGYAMPKRMQLRDAEILKQELHVNAVRTSHYPQSKHFINRCDELGLLVFTELPGWQFIGDERWKEIACNHVKEMVLQYRNHPSIILWGVRINESQDDDNFYTRTNQIAHELDPTRQTGGVRFLKKSNLLEDVYTYNDFLHNGLTKGLDKKKNVTSKEASPYLVTEFNGHMFPAKTFDSEEHRLQHALRHTCVLDALFEQETIAGGFGWCMFDYNTHKDFGSGDRICYHGVLDMFRNPKLAASVYASQTDHTDICEVSSSLDIGDHPAGNITEVFVFTNADSIKLYKNDTFIKEFYPNKTRYLHLPHPPVIIDDFVGNLLEVKENYSRKTAEGMKEILFAVKRYGQNNLPLKYKLKMAWLMLKEHLDIAEGMRLYYKYIGSWGGAATTFRFEAVKNSVVTKTVEKRPVNQPKLVAVASDTILFEAETYDVVDVRICAVDESGNQLPYYQEPITLTAWGAVELIGPNLISLKGGAAGTYVKTKGRKGEGGLRIYQENIGEIEINFSVQ
ncbi:MAG: Beta-galactosidase/beta-glucuronidase [Herbinix sp.]|nr:Beta-galactosidase/beta-glucuronidase [Herbinix sp.]